MLRAAPDVAAVAAAGATTPVAPQAKAAAQPSSRNGSPAARLPKLAEDRLSAPPFVPKHQQQQQQQQQQPQSAPSPYSASSAPAPVSPWHSGGGGAAHLFHPTTPGTVASATSSSGIVNAAPHKQTPGHQQQQQQQSRQNSPRVLSAPHPSIAMSHPPTPKHAGLAFEAKFKPSGRTFLKELFSLLRTFTSHTNLYVSQNGLSLQFVHCFGQALISVYIDNDSFDAYSYPASANVLTVGLKIALLYNYLQVANEDDSIVMRVEDERGGIARIYELYMENHDKSRKVLYEIDSVPSPDVLSTLPEPVYHAVYKVPAEEFCRICSSLSFISDKVTVLAKEKQVTFMASGQEGTVQIGLAQKLRQNPPAKPPLSVVNFTNSVHQSFDLSYLMKFNAAASLSTYVHIFMAVNSPMRIQFDFDKVDTNGFIHFYVAPTDNVSAESMVA
ncbi:hypothetical protein RI367_001237 [Sorochytrium milnesiophthora]